MITKYERIVLEQGEAAAKEYMRNIRKKVNPKNIKGRPKGSSNESQDTVKSQDEPKS